MEKQPNGVTLKEYLNERIDNLRNKVDALEKSNAEAVNKSAVEIERRLETLNGEAGRIAKVLEASIPREVHERDIKEITGKLEALTIASKDYITRDYLAAMLKVPGDEIKVLNTSKDINTGKTMERAAVVAILIALAAIAVALWK